MATYGMYVDPRMAAGSFGGGGWGGIGDIAPSFQYGLATALPIAHSMYDLQNRVMTDPYRNEATIAGLNANRSQAELNAMNTGIQAVALNRLNNQPGLYLDELQGRLPMNGRVMGLPFPYGGSPVAPAPQNQAVQNPVPTLVPRDNFSQANIIRAFNIPQPDDRSVQTFPVR